MKMKFAYVPVALICAWSAAGGVHAQDLKIAFADPLPPYVIKENNTGYELETLKEALALKGYKLIPVYLSSNQLVDAVKKRQVDGAARGAVELQENVDGYYGEKAVTYKTYAIGLRGTTMQLRDVTDMQEKSIMAYKGSTDRLGRYFRQAVAFDEAYQETNDLETLAMTLYSGKKQLVVADINAFNYSAQKIAWQVDIKQDIVLYDLFAYWDKRPNPIFLSKQVRADFNDGLRMLQETQRDKQLVSFYMTPKPVPVQYAIKDSILSRYYGG